MELLWSLRLILLSSLLRDAGGTDLADVKFAVLESGGTISIVKA